jgi:hypothetical protein
MEKFEALKEEFSKFLIHLEKTIDSIDIEHPFNTFVEFTFDRGQYKSGMLVNYDFVRMYDIFDEKIKSYIQTIKETDPKEFSPIYL